MIALIRWIAYIYIIYIYIYNKLRELSTKVLNINKVIGMRRKDRVNAIDDYYRAVWCQRKCIASVVLKKWKTRVT